MSDQALSWNLPSYSESNSKRLDESCADMEGVFELTEMGDPKYSTFPKTDSKTKEIIYEKDSAGNYVLDANGERKPIYPIQSQFTWTCLDFPEHPMGDQFIGSKVTQFYTLSMHEDSHMFKVIKALLGGEVDPNYRPMPSDLTGRVLKAKVVLGKPKGPEAKRYPKLEGYRPARGFVKPTVVDDDTDDVPF